MYARRSLLLALVLVLLPLVSAHEVYVLNATTIASDMGEKPVNVLDALQSAGALKSFMVSVAFALVAFIAASYLLHTKISKRLDDKFAQIRPYAHLVIRVGLGISFLWGAYHNSVFGPELPLDAIPGGIMWKPVLMVIGALLILGLATRLAALVAFAVFATVALNPPQVFGALYMINYLNYFGEIVVLLLERGTKFSLDERLKWPSHIFHPHFPKWIEKLELLGEKYSFVIIRASFGIALVWAAVSIKIMHPRLSLDVLSLYVLDQKVSFTALFVVLSAGIIEIILGLVLIFGVMYRAGLFVLVFFVGYSVWFFGEDVWPHAILVALGIGLFMHGKDKWCQEDNVFRIIWGWTKRFRKSKNPLSPE